MRALVLLAILAAAPLAQAADEGTGAAQRIKAAFLYKFAAFVEWPERVFSSPESPIVIGVVAAEALAQDLAEAVSTRKVGGRPMLVRRFARGERPGDCCQILFIGAANERARAAELLAQAQGQPVLTVTEADSGHPKGSVINFLLVEDRVRFDIAREAAERNGLQLRSQLLAVARQVSSQ
jgi:hypothetical protein